MTGVRIALSAITAVGGIASTVTGGIMANVPGISGDTPVNLTLALVAGGIGTTAVVAWKVSRAWSKMETDIALLTTEVASLKKSRSAEISAKLRAYEAQLEAEATNHTPRT